MRLCSTVQLSDTGIVPGGSVGNHHVLSRDTLRRAVYAIGVPGRRRGDADARCARRGRKVGRRSAALRGHETVMVTTRDIDAQIREARPRHRFGIDLALQPLDFSELCALMG